VEVRGGKTVKKRIVSWVLVVCLALAVFPVTAFADPVDDGGSPETVTLLEITDAIAPINGGVPVTAIAETAQYTGTVAWQGEFDDSKFIPNSEYTATITLTAKEGYTFEGVAEDAFTVACAMSTHNEANSQVIQAHFISPPNGYITDGNGVMAYAYTMSDWWGWDSEVETFDIKGFFHNNWKSTTYSDDGYTTEFEIDGEGTYIVASGSPEQIGDTDLTMDIDFAFVSNGRALQVRYTLYNPGPESAVISFGSHADIQIGADDQAPISVFDVNLPTAENRGFKMVSSRSEDRNEEGDYVQFNFFGKRSVGVTDVDTYWYGAYFDAYGHYAETQGGEFGNLFTQVEYKSLTSKDSGIAYSWKNRIIGPGQTQVYTVVIGIGGADSGDVLGYSVSYDDNVDDAVLAVPDTQQKIENVALEISRYIPVRNGYVFDSWNTERDGSGTSYSPGAVYTENASLILYAQWREAPQFTGPYVSYRITAKAAEGGSISPSGDVMVDEWQDKTFTITPNEGYVISDVLVDGESVGPVDSYVFNYVTSGHTIEAIFVPQDSPFVDVGESDWFFDAVLYSYHRGLLRGTSEDTFDPHGFCTRAMIPTFLYRLEGSPEAPTGGGITDVEPGMWYTDGILWSAQNEIVLGMGDGTFAPKAPVTREQLAAMLFRYAQYKGWDVSAVGDLSVFSDADQVSAWALESLQWAVGSGLLQGKGNGVLDPRGTATRAELATLVMNFLKTYDPGRVVPSDG
jgi:uncharacterized repeat protein (TIGR02543 family)